MIMFSLLFLFPVPLSFYPSLSFVCTISLALLTLAVCLHQDWECIKQTLLHVHTQSSPPSTTHTHTHTPELHYLFVWLSFNSSSYCAVFKYNNKLFSEQPVYNSEREGSKDLERGAKEWIDEWKKKTKKKERAKQQKKDEHMCANVARDGR